MRKREGEKKREKKRERKREREGGAYFVILARAIFLTVEGFRVSCNEVATDTQKSRKEKIGNPEHRSLYVVAKCQHPCL